MKYSQLLLSFGLAFVSGPAAVFAGEWRPLLTPDLAAWEIWAGVPHESVPIEWEGKAKDAKSGRPLGLGRNERGIYTVSTASGEPVLRVSGEIYAALTSREEFSNYHLRLEFKWGDKKWPPREERLRDSGVLYHCVGPHGAFWNVWMRSLEFQVQEGDCGDLYLLGGTAAQVAALPPKEKDWPVFDPSGALVRVGAGGLPAARHGPSEEKAHGEWNTLEIIAVGDRAVHLVNGRVVLALQQPEQKSGDGFIPLARGKLQLQSEGAELFYRRVEIRPLDKVPEDIARAAGWTSAK
jgi:hypothetical protein